jgi:hypothetical protein
MRRFLTIIDATLGVLLFLSGFLHNVVIVRVVQEGVSLENLWIITGGLLMNTLGALNLARVWHGRSGFGLRWLCIYCNLAFLAWFITFDIHFGTTFPYQAIIFTIVAALLTIFSVLGLGQSVSKIENAGEAFR